MATKPTSPSSGTFAHDHALRPTQATPAPSARPTQSAQGQGDRPTPLGHVVRPTEGTSAPPARPPASAPTTPAPASGAKK